MEIKEEKTFENYLLQRNDMYKSIEKQRYQDLVFSEEEEIANQVFRRKIIEKRAELPNSFYREYTLKYLNLIDNCELFNLIEKMPKGGVLHIHLDCCFHISWVILHKFVFYLISFFNFCEAL